MHRAKKACAGRRGTKCVGVAFQDLGGGEFPYVRSIRDANLATITHLDEEGAKNSPGNCSAFRRASPLTKSLVYPSMRCG
jgi:hypothetical protein